MTSYQYKTLNELKAWQIEMQQRPTTINKLAKKVQDRINSYIPEKVHKGITVTIKKMFEAVLFGAELINQPVRNEGSLEVREAIVLEKINFYRNSAAVEGGITGAGGILMGLADFPLLLSIKIKLLFEIAAVYGFNINNYKERLYILYIFQLAFSSHETRAEVFLHIQNWKHEASLLPEDINDFNWRTFQQEYRDYIDLAKMAQLIPVIGAPIGAVVNYRLIIKLGKTAMNAYRMRLFQDALPASNEISKSR